MREPPAASSVAELRQAVGAAVAVHGLRRVAGRIGVVHGTVLKFLAGAEPQTRTLHKLRVWHRGSEAEVMREALARLVARLPKEQRERATARLLETIREIHERAGVEMPAGLLGEDGDR